MTNILVRESRLSPQQARVWALAQAAPGFPLGVACVLRLRGPVDGGALRAALGRVVARHEILRTQVRPGEGGEPVQVVAPSLAAGLEVRDLGGLAARDRASLEAAAWQGALAPRSGAEDAAPLRAVLFRRAEDDHVLHLSLPAVCADAATLDALVAEIGAAYAAEHDGGTDTEGAEEGEAPLQYADFAAWLHETAAADETGEGRSFWARQPRADEAALPELWPGVPVHGASGTAVEHRRLDVETARRVDEAAAAHGTDAEAWLLAAWRIVLRRHVGDEAFAVGVAVDGRTFDELRGSLGPFTRSVPVSGEVDGAAPFSALAAATGDALAQARAWQEAHEWPAANGHGPPHLRFGFDWTAREDAGRWGGVEWSLERRWHQTERFGLRLSAERVRDGLRLALAYDAAAVPAEGAARLLRRYSALLRATLADPAAPADALPLMDAEEQAEALGAGIAASFAADEPLHRRFERQAAATPDAVAVTFDGDSLTYAALDARADRIGRNLRGLGVRPESRVGLCLERGMDAVAGILGILKAGGAYVPMDPAYPTDRLRYVMRDAGIRVLLTHERLRETLPAEGVDVVCLDSLAEAVDADAADAEADGPPEGGAEADSLAYIIYTSGSTGRPKGVQVTHANVSRLFASTEARFGFGADDVWTMFHSLAFDFSVWELWGALLYGGRLVVVPFLVSRSPADFRALLAREGVTVLSQTPSAFRQLIAADEGADSPLALRWVVFGGEALEPAALRPWVRRHGESSPTLVNMYGITETTVHVTHRLLTRGDVERGGRSPVGVPLADLSVYVLDNRLAPVPPALPGEMYVGGAGVARGYLGRPGLTADRFVPDPFSAVPGARMYRSGDRARRLPGGDLEFLGRADEQVKIRGFRIEPGEIEAVLRSHATVADAAVVAREDAPGERRLVAYVVPAGDAHPAAADLRAHAGAALPEYMVPAAFVVLDRLPLTPNGKLDRRALPAPAPAEAEEAYVAPRTTTEEVLAAIWAEVLGVERVGIDDSFFALGGDSILSVRIAARAREGGMELQVADLFTHSTVRTLAERVAQGSPEAAALEAILQRDRRPSDLISEEDRALLPEDAEDAYPLAALQAGMLYHQELSPDERQYHNVDSYHFRGAFHEAAFRAALQAATARQENLRTSIHMTGFSEPLQVVRRHAEIPLVVEDIRHLDDAAQETLLRELAEREWRTPFDLARAPLLRMRVHLRADDRFQVTVTENHAINDGWSLTSLFADLFADHAALLRGEPRPERPRPTIRFRDFIELERATMDSEAARRFWAERLDGVAPAKLPRLPGAAGGAAPGTELVVVPLSTEVRAGLAALARRLAVPLKSVLLAAHLKVMALSTGEHDVVTGLATNGRPEVAGGTDVRGLFLNTVPLRLRVDGRESWESLVRRAFRAEAELLPHRRYPLSQLQREHGGGEALFETAFNLVRFHALADLLGSGAVDVLSGTDVANTSHTLSVGARLHPVTSEILLFGFNYRVGVLTPAQAEAIADRYRRVYEAMVADPSGRHDRLSLVSAEERAQVVDAWNRTDAAYPADAPVHRLFEEQAARAPDAVALVHGDDATTYGELNARANRLAHHLIGRGVGLESPVGVYLERGPELVVALLAVLKAGGAYVPLEPGYPAERLAYMAGDAGVAVLVTQASLRGALPAAPGLAVVSVDEDAAAIARASGADPEGGAGAGTLAYVMYTSGSTGVPKGVAVEHRAVVRLVRGAGYARFGPDEVLLQAAPVSFDASTLELWGALLHGARLVLMPPGAPTLEALGHALRHHGVTTLWLTAGLFQAMAEARLDDLAGLRQLLAGGDVLPAAQVSRVLHRHPGLRLINGYGPTEGTTFTCCHAVPAGWSGVSVPIGRPVSNTRVYVLDAGGEPVAPRVPGELYAGGDGVARGYAGRPGLTAERFVPDPFGGRSGARLYRTGDRARWLPDGTLEYLGRLDGQVKIRGFRIEPGEVESVLSSHPDVREARVVVRDDVPGEKRLVAYVVGDADPDGLRAHLRRSLPEYMVPSSIALLDEMPLTPNGKLDRGALPAPEHGSEARYVAPRTPAERLLAEIWAEVLRRERVGVEESFFELGGHSLLAIRMITRVREVFGVEMLLRTLFENPTVAGVARALESAPGDEAASAITPADAAEPVLAGLNELPEEEVDRLLRELAMEEEYGR